MMMRFATRKDGVWREGLLKAKRFQALHVRRFPRPCPRHIRSKNQSISPPSTKAMNCLSPWPDICRVLAATNHPHREARAPNPARALPSPCLTAQLRRAIQSPYAKRKAAARGRRLLAAALARTRRAARQGYLSAEQGLKGAPANAFGSGLP